MNAAQLQELNGLLSTCALAAENAVRQPAEKAVLGYFKTAPEAVVSGLVHLLRASNSPAVRCLCAILLRKKIPAGKPLLYERLSPELQARLKSELLASLATEQDHSVRVQVPDTVAEIAEVLVHKNGWPELFPFLLESVKAAQEPLRVAAMKIIGNISDACPEAVDPHVLAVYGLYAASLGDASPRLRSAAAIAACQTFTAVDPTHNKTFQNLVPRVCEALVGLVRASEETDAMHLLEALADALQENVTFFRPHIVNISQLLGSIGAADNVPDGIRQVCVECLVLATEASPGMIRKFPVFIQNAVQAAIALMLSFEDDSGWGEERTVDDDLIDNSNFGCGEMAIDRLSFAVRGEKLRPILLPILMNFLQSQNWRQQYVAISAFGQVAEILQVDNLPMVELLPFLTNPQPRIRYAVLECIGQMASDFQPKFQRLYHKIIPRLLPLVRDSQPRVQRHAAGAVFAMIEALDAEEGIAQTYAAQIFEAMAPLLQQSDIFVKEQVVSTLGAVCVAAPEALVRIYDSFMGSMKALLLSSNGREQSALRGRVMECMAFVGLAAGKERFSQDAHQIMSFYIQLLQQGLPPDDVCVPYMMNSWPKICQILKSEFVRYLPTIMPIVLQAASKQEPLESAEDDLDDTEIRVQSKTVTSSISEKADACFILCAFANELGAEFAPYLESSFQCIRPLMQFYTNDEVRSYAISCLPEFLSVAVAAEQAMLMPREVVATVYREIVYAQLGCLPKEPDHELLMSLISSLETTVEQGQSLGQTLDETALLVVAEALFKLLGASLQRMREREESKADEDYDEDMEARINGENMNEDELNFAVAECIGSLMKLRKEAFAPAFAALMPQVEALLGGTFGSIKIALFIIDDFVQYCGQPVSSFFPKLIPLLFTFVCHPRPELRQAAAFGLGLCAENCANSRAPLEQFLPTIIQTLQTQATAPRAREPENASATDNMTSALLKISLRQNRPELIARWCSLLPILVDEGEAEINHTQLCHFLSQGALEGENFAHAVRCLVSLVTGAVPNLVSSEELTQKMVVTLRALRERPDVKQFLGTLPQAQQRALTKALR